MPINLDGKKISKIYMGDKLIMESTKPENVWLPTVTQSSYIATNAMLFRDNGDGTGSLSGYLQINQTTGSDPIALFSLPQGYTLTGIINPEKKGLGVSKTYGGQVTTVDVSNGNFMSGTMGAPDMTIFPLWQFSRNPIKISITKS